MFHLSVGANKCAGMATGVSAIVEGTVELGARPNIALHQCCFEDLQVVENMLASSVS